MNPTEKTPEWVESIRSAYVSGAYNQFIIHGNVLDTFPREGRLLGLIEYLRSVLLQKFDLVFTYGLERGVQVLKKPADLPDSMVPGIAKREDGSYQTALKDPEIAFEWLGRRLLECVNLARTGGKRWNVGLVVDGAHLIAPASAAQTVNYPLAAQALALRNWSHSDALREYPLAVFLVTESLAELHPVLAKNPRALVVTIPLPDERSLAASVEILAQTHPQAIAPDLRATFSHEVVGATLISVEARVKRAAFEERPISLSDVGQMKKELVERDAQNLFEFIPPTKSFKDLAGNAAIKSWVRRDLDLWHQGKTAGVPMGYLLAGPVGTGKTYFVECLGGEAGMPVVRWKNFRDRWSGSAEANLERIFTLGRALGRVIFFVDEADQMLGKRSSGDSDAGLSGRIYGMIADEMSRSGNRGRILWILATSRPDLIEVDLKRPGRVDVKIPILPTVDKSESFQLLKALLARKGIVLPADEAWNTQAIACSQEHITAGAAEALAAKLYRTVHSSSRTISEILPEALAQYQQPTPWSTIEQQISLAVNEATDLDLIPPVFLRYRS